MRIVELNHVAIHVANVDASVRFYRDTMKFPVMDRPAFDFPGAWFRLGTGQELHLIGDRTTPVQSHHRGGHLRYRWIRLISGNRTWTPAGQRVWHARHVPTGLRKRLCKIRTGTGLNCSRRRLPERLTGRSGNSSAPGRRDESELAFDSISMDRFRRHSSRATGATTAAVARRRLPRLRRRSAR